MFMLMLRVKEFHLADCLFVYLFIYLFLHLVASTHILPFCLPHITTHPHLHPHSENASVSVYFSLRMPVASGSAFHH